jgi:hypothetical protein
MNLNPIYVMNNIKKLLFLFLLCSFMVACGGSSMESTANDTIEELTEEQAQTVAAADSLVTIIEAGVQDVKEATKGVEQEVDELLKDI